VLTIIESVILTFALQSYDEKRATVP